MQKFRHSSYKIFIFPPLGLCRPRRLQHLPHPIYAPGYGNEVKWEQFAFTALHVFVSMCSHKRYASCAETSWTCTTQRTFFLSKTSHKSQLYAEGLRPSNPYSVWSTFHYQNCIRLNLITRQTIYVWCNIQALSCSNYCSGKAINITCTDCFCRPWNPACSEHMPYVIFGLPGYVLSYKRQEFRKKN